jgi:hypothetical protein
MPRKKSAGPKPPQPVDDCERGIHVVRPQGGFVIAAIYCDSCGGVPMIRVEPNKFICPQCEHVALVGAAR